MAKATQYKRVTVKEDPKTTLRSAKIHPLQLDHGKKIVALGYMYYPYHDRAMFELVLDYLRDEKPDVVLLMGGMVSEDAFKAAWDDEQGNLLHDTPEVREVLEAKDAGMFEDRIKHLADRCREEFFMRIAEASGGLVIWDPAWVHKSMPNEYRMMEWIQNTKRALDKHMRNNPDASDVLTNHNEPIPKELSELFGLDGLPNFNVLRYGAGINVNSKLLFMIGSYKRRQPGMASFEDWKARKISLVRSFDGKVASWWMTTPHHTLPGLRLNHWQGHEIGFLFDPIEMSHLEDYDFRAQGFWTGSVAYGEVIGRSVPVIRGTDGRRSFVVHSKPYTEPTPGCTYAGAAITLPNKDAVLGTAAAISSRPAETSGSVEPAVLGTEAAISSRPAKNKSKKKTDKKGRSKK